MNDFSYYKKILEDIPKCKSYSQVDSYGRKILARSYFFSKTIYWYRDMYVVIIPSHITTGLTMHSIFSLNDNGYHDEKIFSSYKQTYEFLKTMEIVHIPKWLRMFIIKAPILEFLHESFYRYKRLRRSMLWKILKMFRKKGV